MTNKLMTRSINSATNNFLTYIRRGQAKAVASETQALALGPYVSPDETVSVKLATGILFNRGKQACVVVGVDSVYERVSFGFTGFTAPYFPGHGLVLIETLEGELTQ